MYLVKNTKLEIMLVRCFCSFELEYVMLSGTIIRSTPKTHNLSW
jgi:hypothetical protein